MNTQNLSFELAETQEWIERRSPISRAYGVGEAAVTLNQLDGLATELSQKYPRSRELISEVMSWLEDTGSEANVGVCAQHLQVIEALD